MLDEHDSSQDIIHFEHKLQWLCFGLTKIVFMDYKFMIIP